MIGNENGFTIRALVIVLAVMGALALAAVWPYYCMHPQRVRREVNRWIDSADLKLHRYKDENGTFPSTLDNNPAGAPCKTCFSQLNLENFDQKGWHKKTETEYFYFPKAKIENFRTTVWVRYDPVEGRLRRFDSR